ncbi:MAG: hypothetical protein IT160_04970 [Bryobacterales bacterium]|nr:hypothetical protein [Bryobacterales bacterium]
MRHPIYLFYGLTLLGLIGAAEYRGFTFAGVNEAHIVPRTVRDNPGAYRPHYSGYNRYVGGK